MKHENLPEKGVLHEETNYFPYRKPVCPKKVRLRQMRHEPDELC